MPFTETPNVGNQHQYDLTLTLPSVEAGSDDALFANADGDTDLFAQADGITGQIIMKESAYVDAEVDGVMDKLATEIDATGTFTGQNVPLEAVRSLGTMIGILSRSFFGAVKDYTLLSFSPLGRRKGYSRRQLSVRASVYQPPRARVFARRWRSSSRLRPVCFTRLSMRSEPRVFSSCDSDDGLIGAIADPGFRCLARTALGELFDQFAQPAGDAGGGGAVADGLLRHVNHAARGAVGIVAEALYEFADFLAVLVAGHGNQAQERQK